MVFHVVSIFPDFIKAYFKFGVLSRALEQKLFELQSHDLRDYSINRYRKIDKPIFGHGKGMLFEPEPLAKVIDEIRVNEPDAFIVHLSPQGKPFTNETAKMLSKKSSVVLISSRYEGIDSRIIKSRIDLELSTGDYVLTGGELPALSVIDATVRFIDGTIEAESVSEDSFENGRIECEHFTEPKSFEGLDVPEVLFSGNHAWIEDWRKKSAIKNTYFSRPDLIRDEKVGFPQMETNNALKRLKKENKFLKEYLSILQTCAKEWKDGRRNGKER